MWNVLLDPLPTEWNGYPIDSDFQIGIQISQCLNDESLSETEQFFVAADLLFPDEENRPGIEETATALKWFLSEFHHDNNTEEKDNVRIMDFDIDQWRIYAAFLNQYHIDLNSVRMHWFVFMGLLVNLNECTFTHVINIRQKKITAKMSMEEKQYIKKSKRTFAIKAQKDVRVSASEQKAIEEFLKYANVNK